MSFKIIYFVLLLTGCFLLTPLLPFYLFFDHFSHFHICLFCSVSGSQQRRPPEAESESDRVSVSGLFFTFIHSYLIIPSCSVVTPPHLSSLSGRSHVFRPQIVTSMARPSSPSPFSAEVPALTQVTLPPKSHPSPSETGNHYSIVVQFHALDCLNVLCNQFVFLLQPDDVSGVSCA